MSSFINIKSKNVLYMWVETKYISPYFHHASYVSNRISLFSIMFFHFLMNYHNNQTNNTKYVCNNPRQNLVIRTIESVFKD